MTAAAPLIMYLLQLRKLNRIYDRLDDQAQGVSFLDVTLSELNIRLDIDPEDLNKIPRDGAFISVSNHPFGILDGILLLKILASVRPDFKVMANFLLRRLEPVADYFIPVNPFEGDEQRYQSVSGIKQMLYWLEAGHPAGIFPAGEVSTYRPEVKTITDRRWQPTATRLIQKARKPVLPVYFYGQNSRMFHLLGSIHPMLRTARIPAEFLRKKNKSIQVRIGHPIPVSEQDEFHAHQRLGRYLRARTYALGSAMEVRKFYIPRWPKLKQPQKIIEPVPVAVLETELAELEPMFRQGDFDMYLAASQQIPEMLNEVGRLREITFRAAGEGSNRRIDVDEYDLYYHHLLLWDRSHKQLAGSYRLGRGDTILERYGKRGFYIHSLFHIDDGFRPILAKSVEMGRSFIAQPYQQKAMPLFLLWRGILGFLKNHGHQRYLIGPVTISNQYSRLSKHLLIDFIRKYYFDENLAQFIRPRQDLKIKIKNVDTDILVAHPDMDLIKLDQLIEDVEPQHFRIPVLLKKYIKQNARIIGFNVDPKFNYALDGLMMLDLKEVNQETIRNLERRVSSAQAS